MLYTQQPIPAYPYTGIGGNRTFTLMIYATFFRKKIDKSTQQFSVAQVRKFEKPLHFQVLSLYVRGPAWCRMTVGPRPVSAPLPYSQIRSARGRTAQPESKGETNLTFSSSLVD